MYCYLAYNNMTNSRRRKGSYLYVTSNEDHRTACVTQRNIMRLLVGLELHGARLHYAS